MSGSYKSKNNNRDSKKEIKLLSILLSSLVAALLFCSACTAETTGAVNSDSAFTSPAISLSDIPSYSGDLWAVINENIPFFADDEKTTDVFEEYSELDSLGRCGTAYANICPELMPTEPRGDISDIHPTGWHSSFYDFVDEESLYNRCHLIAHELAGEDANERNLITGTRTFNKDGMQPYENMVADYVHETGNHVLYRVTPMFEGDNLVADGVLMEAYSVEDDGEGICYCVFCYNVEPGVGIDYATGDNWLDVGDDYTYILNTNNMKFHLSTCPGAGDIAEKNRQEYTGSRDDLLTMGYSPCKTCNP